MGVGCHVDGVVIDQVEDAGEVRALLLDVVVFTGILVHHLEAGSGLAGWVRTS